MKYFGEKTKQDFIDLVYEGEVDIFYKRAIYTFWYDGNGHNLAITYFDNEEVSEEVHSESLVYADTVEELIDKYIMYDGVKLSDVMEMDTTEF